MTKKLFVVVLILFLVISIGLISSCKKQEADVSGSAIPTIKPGVLTVGSDCTWYPMEYMEGDKIAGFDVDLAGEIAKRLGLELDYQNAAWDGIFPALIVHKFDMVVSSVTITEDRLKEMDFSIPYFRADQAATVMKDSEIDSVEKLDGKIAGVQIGTTGEITAKEIKGLTVNTYDDIISAHEDLKAGRIAAVICDHYVSLAYAAKDESFKVGFIIVTNEDLGIVFAKDTPELKEAVNNALQAMMDDGTYDKIYAEWFGKE